MRLRLTGPRLASLERKQKQNENDEGLKTEGNSHITPQPCLVMRKEIIFQKALLTGSRLFQ